MLLQGLIFIPVYLISVNIPGLRGLRVGLLCPGLAGEWTSKLLAWVSLWGPRIWSGLSEYRLSWTIDCQTYRGLSQLL